MLRFLSDLVAFDTSQEANLPACAKRIEQEARALGLKHRTVGSYSHPNLIIELNVGAEQTLLLVTHYDVVPPGRGWKTNPFRLTIRGGRAFGRGAGDNKGAVAAALYALAELRSSEDARVNVRLLITCDEERGSEHGSALLAKKSLCRSADAALVLDSGPFLSIGSSGVVFVRVRIFGEQGHAGWPHRFRNAIDLDFLKELASFRERRWAKCSTLPAPPGSGVKRVCGRCTLTMLRAGEKENVIPGECEARFDLRLLPEESPAEAIAEFREFFQRAAARHGVRAKLDFPVKISGYHTPESDAFVRFLARLLGARRLYGEMGGNDGRFFRALGLPVASFGPIREGTNYHGANEFVWLSDLELVRSTIAKIARAWSVG
ncbi:MAG: M20/M25/M40 family metallo-hydrolase [Candidatus Micrarchaeia archaeon]